MAQLTAKASLLLQSVQAFGTIQIMVLYLEPYLWKSSPMSQHLTAILSFRIG